MKKYKRKTKDVKCRKCDRETRVPVEDRLKDISCRCGGRFRLHSRTRNLVSKTIEHNFRTTADIKGDRVEEHLCCCPQCESDRGVWDEDKTQPGYYGPPEHNEGLIVWDECKSNYNQMQL